MKKTTNGEVHRRLNARGFEQVDGQLFYVDIIAAPVTNPNTIQILLTLVGWESRVGFGGCGH